MPPVTVPATIDLTILGPESILIRRLGPNVFPVTAAWVERIAGQAQALWRGYEVGAPLPNGRKLHIRTGEYVRSFYMKKTYHNDLMWEVGNTAPHAAAIEEGSAETDLKEMLLRSLKAKRARAGHLYMHIPFRHGTPGTTAISYGGNELPRSVYQFMLQQRPSHVTAVSERESGQLASNRLTHQQERVARFHYQWGYRLKKQDVAALGVTGGQARRLAGLVHFTHPTNAHHGQYMTFRTISQRSTGWIRPPQPGFHVAQVVADQMRPLVQEFIPRAFARDIQSVINGGA